MSPLGSAAPATAFQSGPVTPNGVTLQAASAGTTAPEIVEMARALRNDPNLIFQYVHDTIEFSPVYGSLKGPLGTLLDGRGGAFDQAALLVALLQQASLTNTAIGNVSFEFGSLRLTGSQFAQWLNTDNNFYSVAGLLQSGGYPPLQNAFGSGGVMIATADVSHVWVQATIAGRTVVFDPAFKAHTAKTGIDLASAMQYASSSLISDAETGATVTNTAVSGINRTKVRADLAQYAGNLVAYIRSHLPAGGLADVVGGALIVPANLAALGATNPNQVPGSTPTAWTTIPASYHATLSLTLPGASTVTYNSDALYEHRLSVFFDTTGVPTMRLDGVTQATGSAAPIGSTVQLQVGINIPWQTSFNPTCSPCFLNVTSGGSFLIGNGWDQVGRGSVERHRALLAQASAEGASPASEPVLGEALSVIGASWLAENAAQQALTDQIIGSATQYLYGVGIVGQAKGTTLQAPYVDLPQNFINHPTRLGGMAGQQTPNVLTAFFDGSGTSSGFEHGVLEQNGGLVPNYVAASTTKILDLAAAAGDTIFDINNGSVSSLSYYQNTIRPQLVPFYDPGSLATMDAYVNAGYRVVAPLHGKVAVGAWTGTGFKAIFDSGSGYSIGEIISGGLSGGFSGTNCDATCVANGGSSQGTPWTNFVNLIGDPFDRQTGSYNYAHDDLTSGPKAFPFGLGFQRSYASIAAGNSGPLGNGWTHNYAFTATPNSDGFDGMGAASAVAAAPAIAALVVSADLINNQLLPGTANLDRFVIETIANRWLIDQLTGNVVAVSQPNHLEHFEKLPDGSYAAPNGSGSVLTQTGSGSSAAYKYQTKDGVTLAFNPAGQIASWSNTSGMTVNFAYNGSNQLSTVSNTLGRQLTLTYTGSQVQSVTDGTGRSVSYAYTAGNLTGFTDAAGNAASFAYDSGNRLAQVFYPSNPTVAFVTNTYDSLGRLAMQADAVGNVTTAYLAGSRTEMVDPVGNRHVWYFDPRGQVTSEIQDYGPSPHLNVTTTSTYDGQERLSTTTLPEGNAITTTYDALSNPLSITRKPKPGAIDPATGKTPVPLVQSFTYITPVAAQPNFEQIHTAKDANGKLTTYSYNGTSGLLASITQPAVSKPGVSGAVAPRQSFSFTSVGLPQSVTDAEGRAMHWFYDPVHADQATAIIQDSGAAPHLNLTTRFAYDAYGDVITTTDADKHATTRKFDLLRRLTEVDVPVTGVVSKFTYDTEGRVLSVARATGVLATPYETTTTAYYPNGLKKTVTDPAGNVTTYVYDADERVRSVTDPVGRQRTYGYDALGRLASLADTTSGANTVLEGYAYTPDGKQKTFADARGKVTGYIYDGFDRLQTLTYPDAATESYRYDGNGNVVLKTTRSGGTIAFAYDALNRVTTKTPQGEAAGPVVSGYDLTSRLLQVADNSSATPMRFAYDGAGRQVSAADQQGRVLGYALDAVGNRAKLTYPDGYFVTYTYDALNRLTEIQDSAATALVKYQWDKLSRRTLETFGDGTTAAFSAYSTNDDLKTLTHKFTGGSAVTFGYSYNGAHQKTGVSVSDPAYQFVPAVASIAYGAADPGNAYPSIGATALTYDGNHNLTFDGANTLAYDVENRLVSAQNTGSGTSTYLYDPLGLRKQKTVAAVDTQSVWDFENEASNYDGAGHLLFDVVSGFNGEPVATVTQSPATATYFHVDAIGSVVAVSAAGINGPSLRFSYGPFGETATVAGAPFRFAGQRLDPETGLYYLRARAFSPSLGRFLQMDPIGYAGGNNLYTYVGNDPVNLTDPTGLYASQAGSAAWGLIQGGASYAYNNPLQTAGIVAVVAVTVFQPENAAALPEEIAAIDATAAAAEEAALGVRGLSNFGGIFSATTNAAGGEVFTSVGSIEQADFASIVNSGLMQGNEVNILTGVHGLIDGTVLEAPGFLAQDIAEFGGIPGVNIYNLPQMTASEITALLNGEGTTIGAFCNSGACLAPFW